MILSNGATDAVQLKNAEMKSYCYNTMLAWLVKVLTKYRVLICLHTGTRVTYNPPKFDMDFCRIKTLRTLLTSWLNTNLLLKSLNIYGTSKELTAW